MVLTLKNYYRRKPQPIREAEARGTPVYVLRANTGTQMEHVLAGLFPDGGAGGNGLQGRGAAPPPFATSAFPPQFGEQKGDPVSRAMFEAEEAITAVIDGAPPTALAPQGTYVRRLQHELADRYNVGSRSRGREPNRRVEIFRNGEP